MARTRSIYERGTTSTLPPPDRIERGHQVIQRESLLSIANSEYQLGEYDPDTWREIGIANNIVNPFTFDTELRGQVIRLPAKALPDFID
jgi:hypothetical protein